MGAENKVELDLDKESRVFLAWRHAKEFSPTIELVRKCRLLYEWELAAAREAQEREARPTELRRHVTIHNPTTAIYPHERNSPFTPVKVDVRGNPRKGQ